MSDNEIATGIIKIIEMKAELKYIKQENKIMKGLIKKLVSREISLEDFIHAVQKGE